MIAPPPQSNEASVMWCLDLKWFFSDFAPNFFNQFVTPLEGTLKIELFSKDVE